MDLLEKLEQAIDVEYDSKNQEIEDLQKIPLEDRITKGDTITNLKVHFKELSGFLANINSSNIIFFEATIKCKENYSKFREGSPVLLWKGNFAFELDIVEDDGNILELASGYNSCIVDSDQQDSDGWQLDQAKVDIRHIVKKSVYLLSQSSSKYEYISGIFNGKIKPVFREDRLYKAENIISKTNLNKRQKEAFIKSYATDNYYLIQGPPGSGKTWLLAHLAVEFAKEGKRVLITANTHTAINNALQKCSVLSHYQHIIKVGKGFQKENLNYGGSTALNIPDLRRSIYENYSGGIIVGATCYSPYTRKMDFLEWDLVIIDEAGQLSIPLAIAAMVKGRKYIFIGDHKQLPPILSENHLDPIFKKSIFEHLFNFFPGIMLDLTYRMNKEINRFPSKQFYNGELLPHTDNSDWRLEIDNHFNIHQEILDISNPEVLFCHFHSSPNSRSEYEAQIISELIDEYLKKGIKPEEIAVITPFRQQVKQVANELSKRNGYNEIKEKLFVDTIERIQGQERDIVIFSLATSNPEKAKERADFFFSPNRLNVALTRAKKKRIVIANKTLFSLESPDERINELIKNFRDFYKDSYKVEEKLDVDLDYL